MTKVMRVQYAVEMGKKIWVRNKEENHGFYNNSDVASEAKVLFLVTEFRIDLLSTAYPFWDRTSTNSQCALFPMQGPVKCHGR